MAKTLPEHAKPRARGAMALAFLLGLSIAVGHHFFYTELSGRPPPAAVYHVPGTSMSLTGQQVNLAVGAALAFLVKSALGAAVAVSAEQSSWRAIKTRSITLGGIDSLLSMRNNLLYLCNLESWKKGRLGVLLTVLYWLLPITSLITPATLTVENVVQITNKMQKVPQIDFTSLNFADVLGQVGLSPRYEYSNPRYSVLRAVAGALSQSSILPIQPPQKNATWTLKFPGPAIECGNVDKDLENNITENIKAASQAQNCGLSYGYISWVPAASMSRDGVESINHLPFYLEDGFSRLGTDTLGPRLYNPPEHVETNSSLRFYIAVMPDMHHTLSTDCVQPVSTVKVVTCQLYNTSYAAEFTYKDGSQQIRILTEGSYGYIGYSHGASGVWELSYTVDPLQAGDSNATTAYNIPLVRGLAYQAVFEAFSKVLAGSILMSPLVGGAVGLAISSNMVNSPLFNTKEMSFLNKWSYSSSLQSASNDGTAKWNGLSVAPPENSTLSMKDTIEDMFKNATISLMSSELLQPNYSSPYAPADTMVETTQYSLLYTYSAATLWVAYGVALGMSLLSVILGAVSVSRNGGFSYTTKFSTILLTSQTAHFSTEFQPADCNGNDPTPKSVQDIVASFSDDDKMTYKPAPAHEA